MKIHVVTILILALSLGCSPEYTSSGTGNPGDETPDNPDTPDTPNTPDRPDTPDTPDNPDVVTPAPDGIHLETCGAEQAWWTETDDWFVDEGFLGVSPNGGLVVRTSTNGPNTAFRLRDGEPLFWVNQRLQEGAMGRDWRVHGEFVYDGQDVRLAIKQLITGTVIQSVGVGTQNIPRVVLNEDVSTALIAGCRDNALTIQTWSLGTGELGELIVLEDGCDTFSWYPTLPVSMAADGKTAVVGGRATGELIHVDLETAQWTSVTAHPEQEEPFRYYGGQLLSAVVRPDGRQAVTAGTDKMVRVWNLPEMELVQEFPTAVVALNLDSYQPSAGSAVSWSPDGRLLGHLDEDANVVVRKTSDWSVIYRIERPVPEDPQNFGGEDFVDNAPVQLGWGEDMKSLAISFDRGVSLWRCEADWARGNGPLSVRLDGPETARVGEAVTLVATHFGEANLHGHTFLVNGEEVGIGTTARELLWTPQQPGSYEITVVVEDGLSDGEATLTIDVR
jgi:hypothetical protein